jgi:hypothetical protein
VTTTQPHTLTYVQPLFLEQQRARDVYPRASVVVFAAPFVSIIPLLIVFLLGQRGVLVVLLPGMFIAAIVLGGVATMMRFTSATTVVETTAIQLRLSLFNWRIWSRTIPTHGVQRVDLTNTTGQLSVLKHGIGELFFMTRKTSVRLHLPEFNYVLIGTNSPEELRDAIQSAIATSTSTTPTPTGSVRETDRADRSRAR